MTGRERDHAGELVFMIREALMAIIRPQPFIAGLLTSIPINRSIPSSRAAEQPPHSITSSARRPKADIAKRRDRHVDPFAIS